MKRAVITGGAGFLGSHLCERLLAEGYQVVCVDNLITGRTENIAHLLERPDFQFLRHDVSKPFEIEGPVDCVLHFASPASPIDYLELPIQTLKVGSLGTHNSLGLAKAKRARICSPPPPRSMAIPRSTRRRKPIGGTSTRWGRAACTTKPSVSPRPWPWPITARTGSKCASCASSTPTDRACACATAAWCRRSSRRRSPASRSPCSARGSRPARSASSPIWSRGSGACSGVTSRHRATSAIRTR